MQVNEEYLNVDEPFALDESVVAYDYHEYAPIVGTNLNNVNSEIRIVVEIEIEIEIQIEIDGAERRLKGTHPTQDPKDFNHSKYHSEP